MQGHFLSQTRKLNKHYQSSGPRIQQMEGFCYIGMNGANIEFVPAPGLKIIDWYDETTEVRPSSSSSHYTALKELLLTDYINDAIVIQCNEDINGIALSHPLHAYFVDLGEYTSDILPMHYAGTINTGTMRWYDALNTSEEYIVPYGTSQTRKCLYPTKLRLFILYVGFDTDETNYIPDWAMNGQVERYPFDVTSWGNFYNSQGRNNLGHAYHRYCEYLVEKFTNYGRPLSTARYTIPVINRPTFTHWCNLSSDVSINKTSPNIFAPTWGTYTTPAGRTKEYWDGIFTVNAGARVKLSLDNAYTGASYLIKSCASYTLGSKTDAIIDTIYGQQPSFGIVAHNAGSNEHLFKTNTTTTVTSGTYGQMLAYERTVAYTGSSYDKLGGVFFMAMPVSYICEEREVLIYDP